MRKKKLKPLEVDMWYGDKFEPKKFGADAYFRDQKSWHHPEHCYVGNIYNDEGKAIGDYTAADSTIIKENFNIEWKD